MKAKAYRSGTPGRARRAIAVLALACIACDDAGGPSDADDGGLPPGVLIVSEPGLGFAGGAEAAAATAVTWVSLPPGTLPFATSIRIRNVSSGGPATPPIPFVDGGFDPVAIPATVGQELELAVVMTSGAIRIWLARVPPRRPPSVVRTIPPKGRTDVALSERPRVVFSEPIDSRSLSASSLQLLRDGTAVPGSVALDPASGWSAEFTPASLLVPGTTYELAVTSEILDLNGDALDGPIHVSFTTTSTPNEGQGSLLTVSNVTTGGDFDPDGFTVTIDGTRTGLMELNELVGFYDVASGPHTVSLSGIAPNCSVDGEPTATVTVASGGTARLEFNIACEPAPELAALRIVFARATGDYGFRAGSAIIAMNADGSGRVQLTNGLFNDYAPDVSPDGGTIAFNRDPAGAPWYDTGIHSMNADGTGGVQLTDSWSYDPDWSPDGTRITFSRVESHWGGPIYVMQASGSGATTLTGPDQDDAWPAWSPDGARIAFTRAEFPGFGTYTSIWVMAADGRNPARITASRLFGGSAPVWSPDGTRIVFFDAVGTYPALTNRMRVVNTDGSAEASLLEDSAAQIIPYDWSADGRMLLFVKRLPTGTPPRTDIFLYRLADGAVIRLTADGAVNETPTFWPAPR